MCLIFVRTKHSEPLNYIALEQAYKDNPDGVGIMWWDNGWKECRSIEATYAEVEQFLDKIEGRKVPWAIHFRWATAGKVNKRNCHPFPIGPGAYLMHNGVLPYTPTRKERSDTWQFAQWVKTIGVEKFYEFEELYKEATKGSRMLYALPNGALRYSGDWTHKPEGYYSNSRCLYVAPARKYYAGNNYNSYNGADTVYGNKSQDAGVYYRYKNGYYTLKEYDEQTACIRQTHPKIDDATEYEDVPDKDVQIIKGFSELSEDEQSNILASMSEEDLAKLMDTDTDVVTDAELENAE
jgi:hypothetical protein